MIYLLLVNVGIWYALLVTKDVKPHNDAFVLGLVVAVLTLAMAVYKDWPRRA